MKKLFSILFLLIVSNTIFAQFEIPQKPSQSNQTGIYQQSQFLSESQFNSLKYKLKSYADSTSTQILFALVPTLNGEDISMVSTQWGEKWGIGQANEDNGIVVLVAYEDRDVDISTGRGVESIISDRDAEQIINQIILPEFKKGRYYEGLDRTADNIFDRLSGNFTEDRTFTNFPWITILVLGLFIFILIMNFRNKGGGRNGGKRDEPLSLLDMIVLSTMGRGSYGGGSGGGFGSSGGFGSGGGGFGGGFGGGSFGGGGASGSW
ncbi:MAG: TPM domain-containing protein [Nonlabens sp.]